MNLNSAGTTSTIGHDLPSLAKSRRRIETVGICHYHMNHGVNHIWMMCDSPCKLIWRQICYIYTSDYREKFPLSSLNHLYNIASERYIIIPIHVMILLGCSSSNCFRFYLGELDALQEILFLNQSHEYCFINVPFYMSMFLSGHMLLIEKIHLTTSVIVTTLGDLASSRLMYLMTWFEL